MSSTKGSHLNQPLIFRKHLSIFLESKVLCLRKIPHVLRVSFSIGSVYGIFTYIWLILVPNVGKYTSLMDLMGLKNHQFLMCV